MNAIEAIQRAAELPVDSVTMTLSRDDLTELVDALNELDGLRWDRDHASQTRANYTEFRPADGHWYVKGGSYTCVGEIADLDTARVRVALQAANVEACKAVLALTGKQSANDIVSAVFDVLSRQYAEAE